MLITSIGEWLIMGHNNFRHCLLINQALSNLLTLTSRDTQIVYCLGKGNRSTLIVHLPQFWSSCCWLIHMVREVNLFLTVLVVCFYEKVVTHQDLTNSGPTTVTCWLIMSTLSYHDITIKNNSVMDGQG